MKREGLRLRLARWLVPDANQPADPEPMASVAPAAPPGTAADVARVPASAAVPAGIAPAAAPTAPAGAAPAAVKAPRHATPARDPWPGICEHFALQMLLLTEQLRPALDRLESDEDDPDRLERLYQVDHAVTRMRRSVRDLRVLAGREDEELAGYTSSLVDVIRMAESAIERYTQVSITTVAELAVLAYVADDVASLLGALLENATSYSPSPVNVSAHLLDDGSVMVRIEDSGIGIPPDQLAGLNAALAGRVPDVTDHTGKHTGFPVVHRLARKHGMRVRLACRQPAQSGAPGGTIAMVTIPPQLLCEIPVPTDDAATEALRSAGPPPRVVSRIDGPASHLTVAPAPEDSGPPPADSPPPLTTVNGLPRRERTSLRGTESPVTPPPSAAPAPEPGEAARAFADDLNAFAAGDLEGRRTTSTTNDDDPPEGQVP